MSDAKLIEEAKIKLPTASPPGAFGRENTLSDVLYRAYMWHEDAADQLLEHVLRIFNGPTATFLDSKLPCGDVGYDWHDESIELYDCREGMTISESQAMQFAELGFAQGWLNFANNTEIFFCGPKVYPLKKKASPRAKQPDGFRRIADLTKQLATATAREKSWHDHILAASGGHATTPETAREFINSLRNMLDVAKGGTKAAVERIRYDVSLVRDRLHSYCEIAETTDDELRSFVPVLQIEECVDDLTKISKENQ